MAAWQCHALRAQASGILVCTEKKARAAIRGSPNEAGMRKPLVDRSSLDEQARFHSATS
jgi:hypothetical protein